MNIPCSVVDFGIDRNSVFGVTRHNLPGQDEFDARQISLPVHEGLSDGGCSSYRNDDLFGLVELS